MTMTLIEQKTLGTAASSIEFTSIPQTFTDLLVLASCRTDRSAVSAGLSLSFNGSTANFSGRFLEGSGSSVVSNTTTTFFGLATGVNATANTFGNSSIYIPDYTGSTNKSISSDGVSENNGTEASQAIIAGLWSNTAAITSLSIIGMGGINLLTGSTVSLYGILKGSGGATVS